MRALAPLPALPLHAPAAAARPFGYPGHVHTYAASSAPSVPLPEGRCAGRGQAPASAPAAVPAKDFDLRAHPIPSEHRSYWEMIGYRFDDAAGSILDSNGSALTEALMVQLERPFDASYERIPADVWMNLMLSGYRLDEETCRLIDPDGAPFNNLSIKIWSGMNRRNQATPRSRRCSPSSAASMLKTRAGRYPQRMLTGTAGTALPPTVWRSLPAMGHRRPTARPGPAAYADSTNSSTATPARRRRARRDRRLESGVFPAQGVRTPTSALGRALAGVQRGISKRRRGASCCHTSAAERQEAARRDGVKLTQNPNDHALPLEPSMTIPPTA